MIPYIGDISKNDAEVLKNFASTSRNILEFGVGASTQVITAYKNDESRFISIDTDAGWIIKTQENLKLLGVSNNNGFIGMYDTFFDNYLSPREKFDFVFDDGGDSYRLPFADAIWPYIKVGGYLASHDTRRGHDFQNVLTFLGSHMDEVAEVQFNYWDSNITYIQKKHPAPYSNWQIDEGKNTPETQWKLGYANPPQEFIDSLKQK